MIKTCRPWDIETKLDDETQIVDIIEIHDPESDNHPYICIPLEAIDEVVLVLLKAQTKFRSTNQREFQKDQEKQWYLKDNKG